MKEILPSGIVVHGQLELDGPARLDLVLLLQNQPLLEQPLDQLGRGEHQELQKRKC